ncbi:MAG TPA: GNAT family N-acetyltransferase [Sulfuriferula sp.]|nr:GNAT family N-acetyltransferase [Sulfuriferula sp.]
MNTPQPPQLRVLAGMHEVTPAAWNRLAGNQPFLSHAFLHALEASGSVSDETGWLPQHLTLWDGERLVAALPLYAKNHSYGEYVFDWAWADAYQRNGLAYYPKLLSAIPFTPVTGPRLLAENDAQRTLLVHAAIEHAQALGASSFHCLFPSAADSAVLQEAGLMIRHGVQFHWLNHGFASFDDYLAAMSHDKRKKIKQERRRVSEAGIRFRQLTGTAIRTEDWAFFTGCYDNTYRQHRSTPYLNLDFFQRLGHALPDNVLMIVASQEGHDIAAALNLYDGTALYGRYWGTHAYSPALHFETCYYQAIEFCIARGIRLFEGGAQGEHKLARGFLPVATTSAHWLAHPRFARAVETFLEREALGVAHYIGELNEHTPFKTACVPNPLGNTSGG